MAEHENGGAAGQGPATIYPEKPLTIENLAELNRYDEVGRMLTRLLSNGEIDDYDSEIGNRIRNAIKIARGICKIAGVPLSLEERDAMLRARTSGEQK